MRKLTPLIIGLLLISTVQADTPEAGEAVSAGSAFCSIFGLAFWPCLFIGMIVYMRQQLRKESARVWTPLVVDEIIAVEQTTRSEFAESVAWRAELETVEDQGKSRQFITSKSQLEKGFSLLAKLSSLPNLNDAEKQDINTLGITLTEAQQRHHIASTKTRILVALLYVLIFGSGALIFTCLAPTLWMKFLSAFSYGGSLAAMLLAMNYADLRPAYKFRLDESSFAMRCRKALAKMNLGFLNEANREFHTKYYDVYVDSTGKKWYVETEPFEGTFNAIIILGVGYFCILPFIIIPYSLVCFLSNYINKK